MNYLWDTKADRITKGDGLREITPIEIRVDPEGITHYIFDKEIFNNPWYNIPDEKLQLFKNFLEGGSRAYPSDGNIPCDIIAKEARQVLDKIIEYSKDPDCRYYEDACKALEKGKKSLVRGTLKLYLGKYTTRDWRRKRFTDDIDFWIFNFDLLDAALTKCGFVKNKETKEWEKRISWYNPKTCETRHDILYAANNINQILDFGSGSYLKGSGLEDIVHKKLNRGHDVDLSDLINVAMLQNHEDSEIQKDWADAWRAFEEAANTRNKRTISNMISLCRYAYAIADHLEKVSEAIKEHHELVCDSSEYPESKIKELCRNVSIHWEQFYKEHGIEETREMLHEFLLDQLKERPELAQNLKLFAQKVLDLINSKFMHQKVIFEIQN
ncbi:MAG: hypothetical protein BAJALOKI1v1_140002 [Promethearchaeota archaeon]|nr:MAG: hypothetical protein BAJALOKI1v1_140002 [Candidatus Lokiarchaeota archaeon]